MLFAHQGGWDEILFALAPVVVVGLLLLLANKRANASRRRQGEQAERADGATPAPDDPASP